MNDLVLTFTNLFPSSVMPTHGVFVQERMRRVMRRLPDCDWQVVAPVPAVAWFVRRGLYRRWHDVPATETQDGVTVHHPRFRHWPGVSMRRQADAVASGAFELVQRLCAGRRAVLDAHYLWPDGVAAATIARRLQLPYVLTARGTDVNVVGNDRPIARRIGEAAAGAAACFGVSTPLCERFARVAGVPRPFVRLARNGVDLERFQPGDAAAARAELGLPAGVPLLLGVGRLVPSKGFLVAAHVLAHLPGVHLVLIGEGPERAAIAGAGGSRVHLLGGQPPERVALAYRASDLFVLPSEREGWPNVVTEALASGLRVVASPVGGIPEILGHPRAGDTSLGALVPVGDVVALADAVRALLAVPGDRDRVRAFAMRYGWDEPVALIADTLRQALGVGAAP